MGRDLDDVDISPALSNQHHTSAGQVLNDDHALQSGQ